MNFFADRCPNCGLMIKVITEPQKVALQMLCLDMEKQRDWPAGSGAYISAKKWKQLLILAWERYHEREAEILPALDGEGWDVVFRRDARLSTSEASEILEFGSAWAADQGLVRTKSPRELRRERDPEASSG